MRQLAALLILMSVGATWAPTLFAQRAGKLPAAAAEKLNTAEDTLAVLAYAVVNDSTPENRFAACRSLITGLVRNLKTPNSFRYPFSRLKSVSIQYPADSSFRIFTWQLYVDENEYRYYGAIQMNSGELQLFPLIDRSHEMEGADLEQANLTPDRWYGAVYYNLRESRTANGPVYLLFGFDGFKFFRKRKIIDVLRFQEGKPIFGAPVFAHPAVGRRPPYTKNRVVLEYSADASVRCNYDEALKMIVFDHLMEMASPYEKDPVRVPDGTYEAYEWKDRAWQYIEQLPTEALDAAPTPNPILKDRPKDILGRQN